jgi:Rrf2 family protein
MLTKTTLSAIRELIHIASIPDGKPLSPRSIAGRLGLSPTYTAKVTAHLARAGILHTYRGAQGGVTLARRPASITLLDIFEACQGKVVGDHCQSGVPPQHSCSFHRVAAELHQAIVEVLSGYSLADLMVRPAPTCRLRPDQFCLIAGPLSGGVIRGLETK